MIYSSEYGWLAAILLYGAEVWLYQLIQGNKTDIKNLEQLILYQHQQYLEFPYAIKCSKMIKNNQQKGNLPEQKNSRESGKSDARE